MAEGGSGIPTIVMGLGHIGQAIARAALEKPELDVLAVVDPARAGERLDAVLGRPAPDLEIAADARRALAAARGGVVLHATGSSFQAVYPQLETAARAGVSVVSTCEELAYPWLRFEELSERLDELCESRDVAVVGVGVNPGFALDRLPAFLSQVTGPVRRVSATRVQDVARRRETLLRRVGAGLDEQAFLAAHERGELGHVGLVESAALAALGCGFELDEVAEDDIEAIVADRDLDAAVPVRAGTVAGVRQVARGFADGTERVVLELVLEVGADDPRDEVELDARPPVRATIRGGLPGDDATAWAVVNAAPSITMLRGLVTALDLPAGR